MNATRVLWPSASSPSSTAGPSASVSPSFTSSPSRNDRLVVDAGILVGAAILGHAVFVVFDITQFTGLDFDLRPNDDLVGVDIHDRAGTPRAYHHAGIERHFALHAGADNRRFGLQQRNRLALHVRTHQRAVGVVMLQERNQATRPRKRSAAATRPCTATSSALISGIVGPATGIDTFVDKSTVIVESLRWPVRCSTGLPRRPTDNRFCR